MTKPWVVDALNRYERPLVRYARRLLGDLEEARDVVQDCFLRLCEQPRERVDGHVKQWLFTVCRNRSLDRMRKDGRMDAIDNLEPQSGAAAPAAHAQEREEHRRVLACLETLPPRQQEVVRLKFQEGLSYKEISAITHASVSNVGVLLHTAIKTLRSRLDPAMNKRTAS